VKVRDWEKASKKQKRYSWFRWIVYPICITWGVIKLVAIFWEEMYGLEPIYTAGTYRTRIK